MHNKESTIDESITKIMKIKNMINPLTLPGEGVTAFTSPYLSAGAPALGEAKGLMKNHLLNMN